MANLLGTVLSGRFRVERLLGSGAMGEVYLADHVTLGRKYAIKVLHEAVEDDERLVERFRREARAASHLDHPNIVSITDFGRTEVGGDRHGYTHADRLCLVMEYVEGVSLAEAIAQAAPGRLPVARVISILTQICAAVGAAHDAGVVHRDLKPDNILLGRGPGGQDHVKILDFGLAKLLQDPQLSQLTRKGEIFGTPAYMSPEQALGQGVDTRADIYSVGAMAYELFAGRLPFVYNTIPRLLIAHQRETPVPPSQHLAPEEIGFTREIEDTILRCLEKAPDHRPQSIAEVQAVFHAYEQRISAAGTKVVPRVVIQESADVSGDLDWCEVTYDASADEVTATFLGDELLEVVDDSEPDEFEEPQLAPPPGASREWFWSQVVKKARSLSTHLRDRRLGDPEIDQVLARLSEFEERTLSLETEIAVARSRIDELLGMTHEAESTLRYAVMDLSMERGQLLDEPYAAPDALRDLDYQIAALEGRLAELYQQRGDKLAALEQSIAAREQHLAVYLQQQVDTEAYLLNLLHRVRPRPCPQDLQQVYQRIEDLLRGMQAAV